MRTFSFDHLDSTQFEMFCYDLLSKRGFTSLTWRKGTGLSTSPSDSGRDIECERVVDDIDGHKRIERWFVECKHYKQGVPPAGLQGALAWANADTPDVLLIIASNFLSNPAKDYLNQYSTSNRPRFRIKTWEKPDLEKLTAGESALLRKYDLVDEFPFLSVIHPAHLVYLKALPFNSINCFLDALDALDAQKRDTVMGSVYLMIIRPKSRVPVTGNETVGELLVDEVSYTAFKRKCRAIVASGVISEELLVFALVNWTLQNQLVLGDITSVDVYRSRMENLIQLVENGSMESLDDQETRDWFLKDLAMRREKMAELIQNSYNLYSYFCDQVVTRLLMESAWQEGRPVHIGNVAPLLECKQS